MLEIGNERAYDVQETAEKLNVTAQTIRNYVRRGRLKAQRVGRSLYISEKTLKEYLNGDKNDYEHK